MPFVYECFFFLYSLYVIYRVDNHKSSNYYSTRWKTWCLHVMEKKPLAPFETPILKLSKCLKAFWLKLPWNQCKMIFDVHLHRYIIHDMIEELQAKIHAIFEILHNLHQRLSHTCDSLLIIVNDKFQAIKMRLRHIHGASIEKTTKRVNHVCSRAVSCDLRTILIRCCCFFFSLSNWYCRRRRSEDKVSFFSNYIFLPVYYYEFFLTPHIFSKKKTHVLFYRLDLLVKYMNTNVNAYALKSS